VIIKAIIISRRLMLRSGVCWKMAVDTARRWVLIYEKYNKTLERKEKILMGFQSPVTKDCG